MKLFIGCLALCFILLVGIQTADSLDGNQSIADAMYSGKRIANRVIGSELFGSKIGDQTKASNNPDGFLLSWNKFNRGNVRKQRALTRTYNIPSAHPRIYLNNKKITRLRRDATAGNLRWQQLFKYARSPKGGMAAKALVSIIIGDARYCLDAIELALSQTNSKNSMAAGDIALIYDWCHGQLTTQQSTDLIRYFNKWCDRQLGNPTGLDISGWGNYWPRYGYSFAMVGMATYGDNPRASEWLVEFRERRWKIDQRLLDKIATGGGWPEGPIYDWLGNLPRVKTLAAWLSVTGENLFVSTDWFKQRFGYLLLQHYPGITSNSWGPKFHPYPSIGDAERNRGTMSNYGRIMSLILIEQFPDLPLAQQLYSYLSSPPTDKSFNFLIHEEFLWFDPYQRGVEPTLLTHYAPALGTVLMRSGWPDSGADKDTSPTYIAFQCGDHFSYHQHYDQASVLLFKYKELLLDSGVYSGYGLSNHDRNYYVRTIAHNSLVVYDPKENFSEARPGATSNDGGQRPVSPASRAPTSVEYFDQHSREYDTCDMLRFADEKQYTYALADATKAYKSVEYIRSGGAEGKPKLKHFSREFVYLRSNSKQSTRDYVVLYDRVGVTQKKFSRENTKLLFHTFEEPLILGNSSNISEGETLYANAEKVSAVNGQGKLFMNFIAPETHNLRKIGGRGRKAWWVFGKSYDWHYKPDENYPRPISDFEHEPYGEWRVEFEPADQSLNHKYLIILFPTSIQSKNMPPAIHLSAVGMEGAHITDSDLNRVVLFSTALDGATVMGGISYSINPTADTHHLLFDLPKNQRYDIKISSKAGAQTLNIVPNTIGSSQVNDQGVLGFQTENLGRAEVTIHAPHRS